MSRLRCCTNTQARQRPRRLTPAAGPLQKAAKRTPRARWLWLRSCSRLHSLGAQRLEALCGDIHILHVRVQLLLREAAAPSDMPHHTRTAQAASGARRGGRAGPRRDPAPACSLSKSGASTCLGVLVVVALARDAHAHADGHLRVRGRTRERGRASRGPARVWQPSAPSRTLRTPLLHRNLLSDVSMRTSLVFIALWANALTCGGAAEDA